MKKQEIKTDVYIQLFETLLSRLNKEVDSITSFPYDSDSLPELDRYLLEINQFYYRSFHEQLIPRYMNKISEEVNDLLSISFQEDTIKKHAGNIIKRYAGLYNQLKVLINNIEAILLDLARTETFALLERDRQSVELLLASRTLQEKINSCTELSAQLVSMAENNRLLLICHQNLLIRSAVKYLCQDQSNHLNPVALCNTLLRKNKHLFSILNTLSDKPILFADLYQDIQELLNSITSDYPDSQFWVFYRDNILQICFQYTELIKLYNAISDKNFEKYLEDFKALIAAWVDFLENITPAIQKSCSIMLPELIDTAIRYPAYLHELHREIKDTKDSFDIIEKEIQNSREIDTGYFIETISGFLEFTLPIFQSICNESAINLIPPLSSRVNALHIELSAMAALLRMLKNEHSSCSNLSARISTFKKQLNTRLDLLKSTHIDLERLLAPRNISRIWKGFDLKLIHVPLETGKPFPSEYSYLIDKYKIKTAIGDQVENTVLKTSGDIFIINVDGEIFEEIPSITISRKG